MTCFLQRWLTSPVRRLSQGKADGQKKPPIRTRRRDNRPELTTPLTGNAQTVRYQHTHTHWPRTLRICLCNVCVTSSFFASAEGEEGGGGPQWRGGGARGRKSHPSTTSHADHQRPKQPRGNTKNTNIIISHMVEFIFAQVITLNFKCL